MDLVRYIAAITVYSAIGFAVIPALLATGIPLSLAVSMSISSNPIV